MSATKFKPGCIYELKPGDVVEKWPDQYLAVVLQRTGETDIVPLTARASMDLRAQVRRYLKTKYGRDMCVSDLSVSQVGGDIWASLVIDGREWPATAVWTSGGFYYQLA